MGPSKTRGSGGEAGRRSAPEWVRKRDGRRVPFRREKIRCAVAAAMEEVGDREASFADEVARVVELALAERSELLAGPGPRGEPGASGGRGERGEPGEPGDPHIEEIQDLVERALMEMGRARAAKAYILYRDKRRRIREALRVHRSERRGVPRVRDTHGVAAWSKTRILASLVEEGGLADEVAAEVASEVERRVLSSGLRRVTTALIRELIGGALAERGLERAWRSHRIVGLPRGDLREVLRRRGGPRGPLGPQDPRADGDGSDSEIAAEIVRRYLLEDVLPEGVAELHQEGDLEIVDLGRAHRPLVVSIDVDLLGEAPSGAPSSAPADELLWGVSRLAREVGRAVGLENPGRLLAPAGRADAEPARLLAALASIGRASGVRVDLVLGADERELARTAILAASELPPAILAGGAVGLFVDGRSLEGALAADESLAPRVERLLVTGALLPTWRGALGGEGPTFAGPGCRRRRGERGALACSGAVALNLPRLARRSGPWHEDLFQRGLADLVQAAVESVAALQEFQRSEGVAGPSGIQARPSCALVPVGLREALSILGEGRADPDRGARILGLFVDAAERLALEGTPALVVSPFFGAQAGERFARLDAQRESGRGGAQRWLFGDTEGSAEPRPYSVGFGLEGIEESPPGRAEAALLRTLDSGVLLGPDAPPAGSGGLEAAARAGEHAPGATPHLARWRRFELFRRSHAGEVVLELFAERPRRIHAASTSRRHAAPLRPIP